MLHAVKDILTMLKDMILYLYLMMVRFGVIMVTHHFMTTRYLVSASDGHCLCDSATQETLTYTKREARKAVAFLRTKGIYAKIITIQHNAIRHN